MTGEQHEKTLVELIITGLIGAGLAALFQSVSAWRKHAEKFDRKKFIIGLTSAGCVGAVVAWSLEAYGVNREASAAIIAMCGYVGGALLDLTEREVPETLQAGFDGLQKRLHEGKLKNDD